MPRPDGGLIQEQNVQYYAGAQIIYTPVATATYTFTFNTALVLGSANSWNPNDPDYQLNNFLIYTSPNGINQWTPFLTTFTLTGAKNNSVIVLGAQQPIGTYVKVQLKQDALQNNYGGYEYVKLNDIVNNFMVGYVGDGKIIQTCKKSDVVFFAKRSLQEFSYDTLKSIKSQELTIPDTLSLIIPQDYVNYVSLSWIDALGVKHPIYPANNLTTDPYSTPIQDGAGVPTQDNFGEDIEGTSITEKRWKSANDRLINSAWYSNFEWFGYANPDLWSLNGPWNWGRLYGIDPKTSNFNGWFGIDERTGRFTFSSNLLGKLIVLEYVSDGLAYDLDTKVPKMAEEAMYKSILYNIVSVRAGQPEGVVQRYKKDRYAALRNAKIRLSNIKLDTFIQVMRGKSKWIKH